MDPGAKLTHRYDDIIHLPHPRSKTRAQMPPRSRAAQFAPFAALTGYDAAIAETARQTDTRSELDENQTAVLNEKLQFLQLHLAQFPEATITFFQPDLQKSGGAYLTISGQLKKIDPLAGTVTFINGSCVPINQIFKIESPLFPLDPERW